ncbi:hypothetical protein N657DRAFT_655535 [Parathielavia appendiculata]|uniref:Uncharacterized protein n=1 Tax=Parathielavia appendiculata TaxID=2587402 RepID=A0AAN6U0M7_9PEZI|nr:hypothetical protein N657DRAFT_655535 [Parathielavia appendiculata]
MRFATINWALTFSGTTAAVRNPNAFQAEDIIGRDVVILGGGATGTYAAVQLRRQGHTVALVEQNSRLEGRAPTVYLPKVGYITYGVEGYFNNGMTKEFFALLDVDYESLLPGSWASKHIDSRSGKRIWPGSDILTTAVAAVRYRTAIGEFDYLATGAYCLPGRGPRSAPPPVPRICREAQPPRRYRLIFTFAQNVGNILDTPLLCVIMDFSISQIDAPLEGSYIRPKNGTNANTILYNSTAAQITRDPSDVQAMKLLVAYHPTLPKLTGFDLGVEETALFSKWTYKSYYAAALRVPSLPDGFNLLNTYPENQPGGTPTTPFQWALEYSGANFTEAEARQMLVTFVSHSPETLMVHVDEMREGFYNKPYGLQDYSTVLWNYTVSIINMMGL